MEESRVMLSGSQARTICSEPSSPPIREHVEAAEL